MSQTRNTIASTSHHPKTAAFQYGYTLINTNDDTCIERVNASSTARRNVCSGPYKCMTYCRVFCCFLRRTANSRKENSFCGQQLNCTSHCKHLAPHFQPAVLLLCSCRSLFQISTSDQRFVNLSLAYSPYRECYDIRLIFKKAKTTDHPTTVSCVSKVRRPVITTSVGGGTIPLTLTWH